MLSFNIRDVEREAVHVDGHLPGDDPVWQEGDPVPAGAVHVVGRLSKAGPGQFYLRGRVEGVAAGSCRRCLSPARVAVSDDLNLVFAEDGDETTDDPDVLRIPPRAQVLDLRPSIREQWLLSAPAFAVCREDCKGLCPSCGADLNAGECTCPTQHADTRWDALRSLRTSSE